MKDDYQETVKRVIGLMEALARNHLHQSNIFAEQMALRQAASTLRTLLARIEELKLERDMARKQAEHWRMCACGGDRDEERSNRLPWESRP